MKKLLVGADPFPPYQYVNPNGEICGSDFEVVRSIIDNMGYTAEYIIDEWSIVEKLFKEKKLDLVFQVQKTPEREKEYFFSHKLRDAITTIVTYHDNLNAYNLNNILEKNYMLGVIENYQYGEVIDSINKDKKIYAKSLNEMLRMVNSGELDFAVTDLGVFNYLNRNNVYKNIKVIENLSFNRPLYVAFNDESIRDMFDGIMLKAI